MNAMLIDIRAKTVTEVSARLAESAPWRAINHPAQGPNPGELFYPFYGSSKEHLEQYRTEMSRFQKSGDGVESARYSATRKYFELWSSKDSEKVRKDRAFWFGETYIEIFRASDGKLLVKGVYDRHGHASYDPVGHSAALSDNEYFVPIYMGARTGLACYFPPETFQ